MKFLSIRLLHSVLLCGRAFVFQHSRWARGTEVSLARCVEIPESCAAGVDQMRETASTIKTEVLEELNATRTRFDQIASDFVGCITLHESGKPLQVELQGKGRESHILPKAAAS